MLLIGGARAGLVSLIGGAWMLQSKMQSISFRHLDHSL